jgi:hypothetical protein
MKDVYKVHKLSGIQIKNPYTTSFLVSPFNSDTKQELRKKKMKRIINEDKYTTR